MVLVVLVARPFLGRSGTGQLDPAGEFEFGPLGFAACGASWASPPISQNFSPQLLYLQLALRLSCLSAHSGASVGGGVAADVVRGPGRRSGPISVCGLQVAAPCSPLASCSPNISQREARRP